MKIIILCILMILVFKCHAQQKIFTEVEFSNVIRKFHPIAKQTALHIDIAKANITISKGAFDPVLSGDYANKDFDGITYYHHKKTTLNIPTWYGIDLFTGIENMSGARINPEETKGNLSFAGFKAPVLQNFVIDTRRSALRQAKIFHALSVVEQKIALNNLLEESLKYYWEWWEHYHRVQLLETILENAQRRFMMVHTAYYFGERAAIDTLEAYTQVQNFSIRLNEAKMEFSNAQYQLSAFLWTDKVTQYELPPDVIPQSLINQELKLDSFMAAALFHPELIAYRYKLDALKIDKKLKFQLLLPELDIKYNQIAKNYSDISKGPWFQNNYRYGISFLIPLRLSEGRGEFKKAKLKIAYTQLEQSNKEVTILTKLKQYSNEWFQTRSQIEMQEKIVNNSFSLQLAEETLFANGESSLFLINSRELRKTEAEIKKIELQKKNQTALIKLKAAAGLFGNTF